MKKVIVVFFLGLELDAEWFFSRLKKKLKVEKIESIRLNPESLIADQVDAYYQAKHRLDCLLEKNSKQKNPEQFFVLALGDKIIDERIWEVVKNYPETATMLYRKKDWMLKVDRIKGDRFIGNKKVFNCFSYIKKTYKKEMKAITKVAPDVIDSNGILPTPYKKGKRTVAFSKEETDEIFEQMNSKLSLGQRKFEYESSLAQQWAEKMFIL